LVAGLLFGSLIHAQATPLEVEQTVIAVYGSSLTFNVRATAPAPLVGSRLIIQIQNREAQSVFAVPINTSGTLITASQIVPISDLNLPPAATLTYYWQFEDATGAMYEGSPAVSRYADNQVPWEWVSQQQENLVVFTDGTDPATGQVVLEISASALSSASQMLGHSLDGEIQIYVYPMLASMANSLRSHHLVVQDWVAAYAIPDQRVIFVAAEPGPDMLLNLRHDLPHEIIHLLVFSAAGDHASTIPGWFNEGLAITASQETDAALDNILTEAVRSRILLSLQTLCVPSFASMTPRDAALAYAQSGSIVSYIRNRYGSSQLSALMSAYTNGMGCSEGVELALGISLTELEAQWLAHLSRSNLGDNTQENIAIPLLIAWLVSVLLACLFIAPQPPRSDNRPLSDTRLSLPPVPSEDT
jgi:hypothetical protein